MSVYAPVGLAVAVIAVVILRWPAKTPRLQRWPWLVALALIGGALCAGQYYFDHMWDDLHGLNLGPPPR